MQEQEKSYIFDNPRNVKALIYGLFVLCGVLFGLDFLIHRHVEHPWEAWIGFYCIYGFVCCVFLVLAAKELRKVVLRGDDYYDE
jgi:hypothetical protein